MNRTRMLIVLAAAMLAAFAGCSGDENRTTGPDWSPAPVFTASTARVVGPTEIVLCLDVSDSISEGELKAQIDGLGLCLQDESIFPSNGNVALSVWVYGDTIAPAVRDLTPVTETTIKDVFQPALTGLITDRLVSGSTAVLGEALAAAGEVLAAGSANDRQVLISGSGLADDEQAARNAAGELGRAGSLVSAIGVAPSQAGEKLLEDCAGAGNGIYENAGDDYGAACQLVFSWMLVVELTVEPDEAELDRGAEHMVEASVYRAENLRDYPEVGLDVMFAVGAGPNAGLTHTAPTDTNGIVKWAYTGDGGAGTDTIVVSTNHPQTGEALVDTVTVTWLNAAPVCDAGGPYSAVVDSESVVLQLDGSASSDADGDTLYFQWSLDCEGASFDDATAIMPNLTLTGDCVCEDSLVVDLMVSDGIDSSSCQAVITLQDERPPVLVAKAPYKLWPPNHKYRAITPDMVLESAEDACGNDLDLSDVVVVSVSSDEPEDHNGDGSTVDDILVSCPNGLQLRAERQGSGDGRVYTILYRITDENGNSAEVEAQVYVPHDQGRGSMPTAGDAVYTVTPDCGDE